MYRLRAGRNWWFMVGGEHRPRHAGWADFNSHEEWILRLGRWYVALERTT